MLANIVIMSFMSFISYACASYSPIADKEMSALDGHDYTALIEGCGNRLIAGYTYCRKTEGDPASESLFFVGPITNCNRPNCVEFKIFPPDGSEPIGDAIPRGQIRKELSWAKLLKRDTFELADRGFWPYTYRVYWVDVNGNENVSVSEGEIRLRVLKKGYIPLNTVVSDSNFTWFFTTKRGEHVKMTTGMRTYVGRR